MDRSKGYEEQARAFMRARNPSIGADVVRDWARQFAPGAPVLELGCGRGTIHRTFEGVVAWGLIFLLRTPATTTTSSRPG